MTQATEIASDLYRISTFVPGVILEYPGWPALKKWRIPSLSY